MSGTPVTIRVKLSITSPNNTMIKETVHQIGYDIPTKTFIVIDSKNNVLNFKDFKQAKESVNEFNIVMNFNIPPGENCTGVLKATLDPIRIEALQGKQFDLMSFWDYYTPTFKFSISRK